MRKNKQNFQLKSNICRRIILPVLCVRMLLRISTLVNTVFIDINSSSNFVERVVKFVLKNRNYVIFVGHVLRVSTNFLLWFPVV